MSDQWMQIITVIGSTLIIVLTFFGITISLHNAIREDIRGMAQEMKDFHNRLCEIESKNNNYKRRKNFNKLRKK